MSLDSVGLGQLLGICILISFPELSAAVGRSHCCPPAALQLSLDSRHPSSPRASLKGWALWVECFFLQWGPGTSLLIPGRRCEWQVECRAGGEASLAVTPTREDLCTESSGQPWAFAFDLAQPLQAFATVGALPCPPCNPDAVLPLSGSSSLLSQGNGGACASLLVLITVFCSDSQWANDFSWG